MSKSLQSVSRLGAIVGLLVLLDLWSGAWGSERAGGDERQGLSGELIVKFRRPIAGALEEQLRAGLSAGRLRISSRLDELSTRYGVREVRPLIGSAARIGQRLRLLREKKVGLLTRQESRILRRLGQVDAAFEDEGLDRVYRIRLGGQGIGRPAEVLEAYRRNEDVEYAEINYVVRAFAEPSDRRYSSQWALSKIGAAEAWDTCRGNAEIVVAVPDTGVDYNHRDLKENVWVNEAEQNGVTGVDDDENGYVDDVRGYNFIYNDSDPLDDHGHGTHCAGIIAAVGNNGLDIAGVCWRVRLMPLKFLSMHGEGTVSDAAEAIYYAVVNGADVISNSWGGDAKSKLLEEVLGFARRRGVIVVAAAGNDNSSELSYPGAYDDVIAVAATDSTDKKWSLSNYGSWVDIAAPGVDVLSLRAGGTSVGGVVDDFTTRMSGTSMAAPHVAAACALVMSANSLLKVSEVRNMLFNSVEPIEKGVCASNGRVNLAGAMRAAVPVLGYVRFDQRAYSLGGKVGILLADRDLRNGGPQQVKMTTREGDLETVVLNETAWASGVFSGEIATDSGPPKTGDGVVQVSHGDIIAGLYFDANDGSGQPHLADTDSVADYKGPVLSDVHVRIKGPVAEVEVFTDEMATAVIKCWTDHAGPYHFVATSAEASIVQSIRLLGLSAATQYYFVVELTDDAGNKTVADSNGLGYSFTTPVEFEGFSVPGMYPTIQAAIDDASDGDTVWVADGRYTGEGNNEIDFMGKAITVRSENGPAKCVIDCEEEARAAHFHRGEDGNSVLDGFTITRVSASGFGGGIRCTGSSPTIRNCIIKGNAAEQYGGGMYNCYGSNPTIIDCVFSGNAAGSEKVGFDGRGGGICNRGDSSPTIIGCTFTGNSAKYSGGGIGNFERCSPRIMNCVFKGNSAVHSGGGVGNWQQSNPAVTKCRFVGNWAEDDGGGMCSNSGSNPTITNCVFAGNLADSFAGALKNYDSGAVITNCTFADNKADWLCGGIWAGAGGKTTLVNCILWGNRDSKGGGEAAQLAHTSEEITVAYSCVEGWTGAFGGLGSFSIDPLFVDTKRSDYHLKSRGWRWDEDRRRWDYDDVTSVCIDAGNPGMPMGDEPLAVPGDPNNEWAVNVRIDMGAYGGTAEASMAPHDWALLADMDNDGRVGWWEFAHEAMQWLAKGKWLETDLDRNGVVNKGDLAKLADDWMRYVKPPMVEMVEPSDGAVFMTPADVAINIEARAWDADGPILRVEFFANNKKIGEDTDGTDGWKMKWEGYTSGVYVMSAKATEKNGLWGISQYVEITVITPR